MSHLLGTPGWKVRKLGSALGYVPKSLLISFSNSSVIFSTKFTDKTVSSIYFTEEALVIADETSLFLSTHAIANWACVHPIYLAISPNFYKIAVYLALFASPKYSMINSWILGSSEKVFALHSDSGIPLLYFPVRMPPAKGDQTVDPILVKYC